MKKKYNLQYQIKIIAVTFISVAFVFFLYVFLYNEINLNKSSIIKEWSDRQKFNLDNAIDDAVKFGNGDFENFIVSQVIPRLKFNEASYAVFYGDNKVIFENSAELTARYSGKTIRETYGEYSYMGGYHLSEVLEVMEKGESGRDYFVKNHAKGKEYITWIAFSQNGRNYILGSVTDEKYILGIHNFESNKNVTYAFAYIYTFLIILLCGLLCFSAYRHNAIVTRFENEANAASKLVTKLKTNIASLEDKFEKLSICDFLTGTYNRKFFDIFYPKLESGIFNPVSIVLIDIDGLKLINSAFGYQEGDNVLKAIAEILKEKCDNRDVFSRYGTDEFAIIMINTSYDDAVKKMLDISKTVSERLIERSVEISFGVATKTSDEDNIYDVMQQAEKNLNTDKLTSTYSMHSGSINMLRKILQERTSETDEHCERIRVYAERLAAAVGMDEKKIKQLSMLAYLHDVGKIAIPDVILNKEGTLTDEEFEIMKTHPTVGYNIAIASPRLKLIAKHIQQHHERWDGKGYPKGIAGEEISLEARIISIADAFDAMISKRVYKDEYGINESLNEILKCAGAQFDPNLARIFVKVIKEDIANGNIAF